MNAIEKYGSVIQELEKFALQLDPSIRSEAFRFLLARELGDQVEVRHPLIVQPPKPSTPARELSPQELLRKVGVQTLSDIAVALGYWLEMYQGEASFTSGRLKEAFDQARETPPVNPSDVVAKLEGAGKLMRAEKVGASQHYRLTRTAIEEIEQKVDPPPAQSAPKPAIAVAIDDKTPLGDGISSRASEWMRLHQITREQLDHIFSIEMDPIDLIAPNMPADTKTQQTLQAYIMCGLCSFIRTGDLMFTDMNARALCERIGCYDPKNHGKILRTFGNLIGGSKEAGWRLTNPGLSEAAKIIKLLAPS